jgi:hypothetical protein
MLIVVEAQGMNVYLRSRMRDDVKVRCSYRTDPGDGADTFRRGLLVFLYVLAAGQGSVWVSQAFAVSFS